MFVYVYLIPAPLILINFDGISPSQCLFVLHKVFLPVLSLKSTKQICILYKFTFHFIDCSLLHMTILYVWSLFLLDKGIGFRWEKKRIRMTVSSDSIYWDKFVREVNGNNIFIWKHGHVIYWAKGEKECSIFDSFAFQAILTGIFCAPIVAVQLAIIIWLSCLQLVSIISSINFCNILLSFLQMFSSALSSLLGAYHHHHSGLL